MVKQGAGKEMDLSKYGAVGVWRLGQKGLSTDLQICTASKIIIIDTKSMRGRDFDDDEAKMKAGEEIANLLFETHSN